MLSYNLIPHPDTPPSGGLFKLWVNVDHSAAFGLRATANLFFCVGAPATRFAIPASEAPAIPLSARKRRRRTRPQSRSLPTRTKRSSSLSHRNNGTAAAICSVADDDGHLEE